MWRSSLEVESGASAGLAQVPDRAEKQRRVGGVVDERERERVVDEHRLGQRRQHRAAGRRRSGGSLLIHLEVGLLDDVVEVPEQNAGSSASGMPRAVRLSVSSFLYSSLNFGTTR